MHRNCYCF